MKDEPLVENKDIVQNKLLNFQLLFCVFCLLCVHLLRARTCG